MKRANWLTLRIISIVLLLAGVVGGVMGWTAVWNSGSPAYAALGVAGVGVLCAGAWLQYIVRTAAVETDSITKEPAEDSTEQEEPETTAKAAPTAPESDGTAADGADTLAAIGAVFFSVTALLIAINCWHAFWATFDVWPYLIFGILAVLAAAGGFPAYESTPPWFGALTRYLILLSPVAAYLVLTASDSKILLLVALASVIGADCLYFSVVGLLPRKYIVRSPGLSRLLKQVGIGSWAGLRAAALVLIALVVVLTTVLLVNT